ncbi:unnamed protein product [Lactuca saligna]|uniref:Uncharacterized protein n=1 Tax=Lactuca saligna TaxID=75948 RepID=A0AA35ZFN9_LACSI|nr:unnamed protein product [Lactuca saligna]
MATPPPFSPDSICINSRDRLNFGDLHTIYYDCGAEISEQKIEVTHLKEEMDRDLVLNRVESLALHRRNECTEKKCDFVDGIGDWTCDCDFWFYGGEVSSYHEPLVS